jgi:hypothetical protein
MIEERKISLQDVMTELDEANMLLERYLKLPHEHPNKIFLQTEAKQKRLHNLMLSVQRQNILIPKHRILKEWKTWSDLSEKYRFQTNMNADEYVMIKTAQEVRNVIARILLGEFSGDNFETSKEKVEKLLE